jgi:DNA-binding NtrC family response regulator
MNKNRILISEDTDLWQGIFTRLLTEAGYEVRSAKSRVQTHSELERYLFDVVLVDICLDEEDESNTDGVENLKEVQSLGNGTQAIVLTGYGTVSLAVTAIRDLEVFHFLEKEVLEPEKFLRIVAQAVRTSHIKRTHRGLSQDPLSMVDDFDFHKAASDMAVAEDDLKFMVRNLASTAAPAMIDDVRAEIIGKGSDSLISLKFWSMAFGCGAEMTIGNGENPYFNETENPLAVTKSGRVVGMVERKPNIQFEDCC